MVNVPTPLQKIEHPLLISKSLHVWVKRDDLIHKEVMGNKWRKLKYLLQNANENGFEKIVTMGGAYSNHIAATAAAGKLMGFQSVGIIRGEELNQNSNYTLRKAAENGMSFEFINRKEYRDLRENLKHLNEKYPDHYPIPEGGTTVHLLKGFEELINEIDIDFDVIIAPIGTGGTFCGLVNCVKSSQKVIGVSSLKGDFIVDEIHKSLTNFKISKSNFEIITTGHCGGYGKVNDELIAFMNWFKEIFKMQLDPIYTGKSFLAVWKMIEDNYFDKGLKIILLHTGGLQGNAPYLSKK